MGIIEELGKNYNLSDKQVRILKVLDKEDLTARRISKEANIPIGRLYEYINKLISAGLVDKSKKKPTLYSFQNKNEKIYNFLKTKFDETIKKESLILAALEKGSKEVKLINSMEEYVAECRRIYSEEKTINFIERSVTPPYYFYPENDSDYKKVRNLIKKKRKTILENEFLEKLYKDNFFENLKKGKKFIGIATKEAIINLLDAVKKALGKERYIQYLKKIIYMFEHNNVECRLSNEKFPSYMIISENFVLICFYTSEGRVSGLVIRDKQSAKIFIEFFESTYKNCEPLLPLLKKLLKTT